jgi:hypothetical protein
MSRWHPWRHARDHFPDVTIDCGADLPPGVTGTWAGECTVLLQRDMLQAERRCTLTHELVHAQRGWHPRTRAEAIVEEAIVRDLAARLLITLPDLLDCILWGQGNPDHEDLWVDYPTFLTRMTTLRPDEQDWIDAQLRERVA